MPVSWTLSGCKLQKTHYLKSKAAGRSGEAERKLEVRKEDSEWRQAFGEAWLRKERERDGSGQTGGQEEPEEQ